MIDIRLKKILIVLVYWVVFVNMFFFNVVLHEFGHYLAASSYDLEPKVDFDLGKIEEIFSFRFEGIPIASTSFIDNGDLSQVRIVAGMGPFINLLLAVIFLTLFVFLRKNKYVDEVLLICFMVSIASFIMNILPLNGADGRLIFGAG